MMKFSIITMLAVALINVYVANSFLVSRVPVQSSYGSRLFAGKGSDVEEPVEKKGPGGKDVIRGILWATTPWIFNSYEVSWSPLTYFKLTITDTCTYA